MRRYAWTRRATVVATAALMAAAGSAWAQDDPELDIPPPPQEEAPATPDEGSPEAASAPAAKPAPAAPAPTPVVTARPAGQPLPWARAHRLAVTIGFGVGSASLSELHEAAGALKDANARANPTATIDGDLKSSLQISGELSVRYYFPYFVLAQAGFGTIYNWASADFSLGPVSQSLENHNTLMEVPLLVGGYYTFFDRLYVHGLIGPSFFFFTRAYTDPGSDFEAGGGVGMHAGAGADYLLAEHFGLGLEVRYRLLRAGELEELKTGTKLTSDLIGVPGGKTYDLDFSGVTVLLNVRLFAI